MASKVTKPPLARPRPDFVAGIQKTGFVLENPVAETLKTQGWYVISNKYYVDDSEETVREIVLVAYRVGKGANCKIFTTLIVSCKKSESNVWALLSRDIDLKAPNSDWWPLHAWTNDKVLAYSIAQPGAARRYHEDVAALGVTDALQLPTAEIFAFQELSRETGAPQNDKVMFSAVTSLMKAQAYELAALIFHLAAQHTVIAGVPTYGLGVPRLPRDHSELCLVHVGKGAYTSITRRQWMHNNGATGTAFFLTSSFDHRNSGECLPRYSDDGGGVCSCAWREHWCG